MGWGEVVKEGVGLANSFLGHKAAGAQGDAAKASLDFTKGVYGDAKANFSPYMQAGQGALAGLAGANSGDYSGFDHSPDYLYARDQAIYGSDHSAAAHGSLYSGGHQVDLANSIAGIASQNFNNWRGSQMGLAQLGSGAASNLAQSGSDAARGVGSAYGAIGDAKAQGYGAIAGGLTGLGGAFSNWYSGRPQQAASGGSNFGIPGMGTAYSNTNYGR